jgi:hypothetical protein
MRNNFFYFIPLPDFSGGIQVGDGKVIVAFYVALNALLVIGLLARYLNVSRHKDFHRQPRIKNLFHELKHSWYEPGLNAWACALLVVNAIGAVVFATVLTYHLMY